MTCDSPSVKSNRQGWAAAIAETKSLMRSAFGQRFHMHGATGLAGENLRVGFSGTIVFKRSGVGPLIIAGMLTTSPGWSNVMFEKCDKPVSLQILSCISFFFFNHISPRVDSYLNGSYLHP